MLQRKIFEITLPDSDTKLKVRKVNTFEARKICGGVPNFVSNAPKDQEEIDNPTEEQISQWQSSESLTRMAEWACAGIVEHPNLTIVPVSNPPNENEYSYFELTENDQAHLYLSVCQGVEFSSKKKEPPKD